MLRNFLLSLLKGFSPFVLSACVLNPVFINSGQAMDGAEGSYSEEDSDSKKNPRKRKSSGQEAPFLNGKKPKFTVDFLVNEPVNRSALPTIPPKPTIPPQSLPSFYITPTSTSAAPMSLDDFRASFNSSETTSLPTSLPYIPPRPKQFPDLTEKEKERIIQDTRNGRLQYEIAGDFGVLPTTMGHWQKRLGVRSRASSNKFRELTEENRKEIMQGSSGPLAIKYKVTTETIRLWKDRISKTTHEKIDEESASSSTTTTTVSQQSSRSEESAEG
jgi:hypothetical protein